MGSYHALFGTIKVRPEHRAVFEKVEGRYHLNYNYLATTRGIKQHPDIKVAVKEGFIVPGSNLSAYTAEYPYRRWFNVHRDYRDKPIQYDVRTGNVSLVVDKKHDYRELLHILPVIAEEWTLFVMYDQKDDECAPECYQSVRQLNGRLTHEFTPYRPLDDVDPEYTMISLCVGGQRELDELERQLLINDIPFARSRYSAGTLFSSTEAEYMVRSTVERIESLAKKISNGQSIVDTLMDCPLDENPSSLTYEQ